MCITSLTNASNNIIQSVDFLQETISRRLQHFFQKENAEPFAYPEVKLENIDTPFNRFLIEHKMNIEEYIILLLALTPHIQPGFLDTIIQQYLPNGGEFTEIGGVKGVNHRGTIPTGETALFILAGNDINKRMQVSQYFSTSHFFSKESVLSLETVKEGEPAMSGRIILQQDHVDLFTIGKIARPNFSADFPARLVTTKMEWNMKKERIPPLSRGRR